MIEVNNYGEVLKYETRKEYIKSCKDCRYYRDTYFFDDKYYKCKYTDKPTTDIEQMYENCPLNHEIKITEEKQLVFEVHHYPAEEFDYTDGTTKVYEDRGYYDVSKITSIDCEADGNNCEYNYITYVTIDYNNMEEKYYARKKAEEICNDLNNMTGFQKVKCYRPY